LFECGIVEHAAGHTVSTSWRSCSGVGLSLYV
jgi:hypothetical protein